MQDRVSANPGRVLITPESGGAYYATIERADNPSVIGTALNKASLLTDTTAADYGLDSTATPNDALQALKKKPPSMAGRRYFRNQKNGFG